MLSSIEKKQLLHEARNCIFDHLDDKRRPVPSLPPDHNLSKPHACFVTLQLHGNLRGCIGTFDARMPLIETVSEYAVLAAFEDPRFSPLTRDEFEKIELEISVLSDPEPLLFSSPDDLLEKLTPNVHGVILKNRSKTSTFLPQVWEQLPDKAQFLEHLCMKAGLSGKCWKDPSTDVFIYTAVHFSESETNL